MTIPAYVVRPEPGCSATVAAASDAGLDAIGVPLFEIAAQDWIAPDPAVIDAVLLGSANAPRHAGPQLAAYLGKPAWCVGETTAQAARAAGFADVHAGSGGLQAVIGQLPAGPVRLLRLCGAERVPLELTAGQTMTERVVYASIPVPLPAPAAAGLASGAIVLLHSAEAARHLAAECDRLGIDRAGIALAALGPRIAAAAGAGWRMVAAAPRPDDKALLALVRRMCQDCEN